MLSKVIHCVGRVLVNARPHQLHWGDWEMVTAILCTKYSLVAGLIQKVGTSSSKASSLCPAVFCLKIVVIIIAMCCCMHAVQMTIIFPICLGSACCQTKQPPIMVASLKAQKNAFLKAFTLTLPSFWLGSKIFSTTGVAVIVLYSS